MNQYTTQHYSLSLAVSLSLSLSVSLSLSRSLSERGGRLMDTLAGSLSLRGDLVAVRSSLHFCSHPLQGSIILLRLMGGRGNGGGIRPSLLQFIHPSVSLVLLFKVKINHKGQVNTVVFYWMVCYGIIISLL